MTAGEKSASELASAHSRDKRKEQADSGNCCPQVQNPLRPAGDGEE